MYRDDKDPCERGMINLAQAKTDYLKDQQALIKCTFSIVTRQRSYLIQASNEKDLHDWLYAINPLLAGQIRSATARNRPKATRKSVGGGGGGDITPTNPAPATSTRPLAADSSATGAPPDGSDLK